MKASLCIFLLSVLASAAALSRWGKTATEIPSLDGRLGHRLDVQTDGKASVMAHGIYSNCVLWYPMSYDDNAGTNYYDHSLFGNDGTQPTNSIQPPFVEEWGGALRFDGVEDTIAIPHDASLALTNSFAMSVWVYRDSGAPGVYSLFFAKRTGASYNWQLWLQQNDGRVRFFNPASGTKTSTGGIADNAWTLVTIVYDGTNIKFFFNGALDSQVALNKNLDVLTHPIRYGRYATATVGGTNDDLRVYNRDLSTNEVNEDVWNATKSTYDL